MHMRALFGLLLAGLLAVPCFASTTPQAEEYYVDRHGILRERATKAEVSFFGVNYTLPFAHAWRAEGYLGQEHRAAIDRDVYHLARLGINAYRLHIWDVEISDSTGNLLENEHLDLLDYLIERLDERGIRVLLTTMTNFGNGYPERNEATGGFSYLYDKCEIHRNPQAITAQQRYVEQLLCHVNPYTGKAYREDPQIVAFEINNEPCHIGTPEQTKSYIDTMLGTIRQTGCRKPIFYNVSHNGDHVGAYYATAIDGTTYQWYPIGLVAGHQRRGNFLPYIDRYHIPFADTKGFERKAKAIYEFDPADILYSYMYPAMVRTFRSAGFQWITQFAYDPMDLAPWNTEYQTHYLNLAYTPNKAISLRIAAEVAQRIPLNEQFPAYPADTVFGPFRVSYTADLSEMNTPQQFLYSNHTTTQPVDARQLTTIAGCGSSPVVEYEGTGAYFLDRLAEGVWRLEVMPDAVTLVDPFGKPSLNRQATAVVWNEWPMTLRLPDLTEHFSIRGLNQGNNYRGEASQGMFQVRPGVYLLIRPGKNASDFTPESRFGVIRLGEYVAPAQNIASIRVMHQAAPVAESGEAHRIEATVVGPTAPDSVVVYPDKVSFWSEHNPSLRMEQSEGYTYCTTLPAEWLTGNTLRYNIVTYANGQATTFPGGAKGMPLDWDFNQYEYYTTRLAETDAPVDLVRNTADDPALELFVFNGKSYAWKSFEPGSSTTAGYTSLRFHASDSAAHFFVRKDIHDLLTGRAAALPNAHTLCLELRNSSASARYTIGFVSRMGFTYTAEVSPQEGIIRIPLDRLAQDRTALVPAPFPVFLDTWFTPTVTLPFQLQDADKLELRAEAALPGDFTVELGNIWIE